MHPRQSPAAPPSRRTFLKVSGGIAAALPLALLAGCGEERDGTTLRVAYQQFGSGTTLKQWVTTVAKEFTKKHPGTTIELVPIVAAENDYFTKNELLMSSPRSCPDVVYEDTFILLSDVAAGYIQSIDDLARGWGGWEKLLPASQRAAVTEDGKIHCIPTETDARGIYYNKKVFAKAGLPTDWQPKTWDEIAHAAAAIRDANFGATGMFMYCGKAQGEKASMQSFEMLLYGTKDHLYNPETKKWIAGSQGFIDALSFLKRQFDDQLTLPVSQHLDPNIAETVQATLFPEGKLGILVDGSWIPNLWADGGGSPWSTWQKDTGLAHMPTQNGDKPGDVTLAGGWGWTIPTHAPDRKLSFELIKELCTVESLVYRNTTGANLTTRTDVAQVEEYRTYSPTVEFFTESLEAAYYRPAFSIYPEVSSALQDAMEFVMVGDKTPEEAAAWYDTKLTELVGEEGIEVRGK